MKTSVNEVWAALKAGAAPKPRKQQPPAKAAGDQFEATWSRLISGYGSERSGTCRPASHRVQQEEQQQQQQQQQQQHQLQTAHQGDQLGPARPEPDHVLPTFPPSPEQLLQAVTRLAEALKDTSITKRHAALQQIKKLMLPEAATQQLGPSTPCPAPHTALPPPQPLPAAPPDPTSPGCPSVQPSPPQAAAHAAAPLTSSPATVPSSSGSAAAAQAFSAVQASLLEGLLGKALLRRFDDPSEACRSLAVNTLLGLVQACPQCVLMLLPYAIPVLEERLCGPPGAAAAALQEAAAGGQQEVAALPKPPTPPEPAEEVRLSLGHLLAALLRAGGKAVGAYGGEAVLLVSALLGDPYSEVNIAGCRALEELSAALALRLAPVAKLLVAAVLPLTTARRHRVRIAAVKALRDIMHQGAHEMILEMIAFRDPNVVPIAAFYGDDLKVNFAGKLATDPHPLVRLEWVRCVGAWMTGLRERVDHEARLLPYALSGLTDDNPQVVQEALHVLDAVGALHEADHAKELRDSVAYLPPEAQGQGWLQQLDAPAAAAATTTSTRSDTTGQGQGQQQGRQQGQQQGRQQGQQQRWQGGEGQEEPGSCLPGFVYAGQQAAGGGVVAGGGGGRALFVMPGPFSSRPRLGSRLVVQGHMGRLMYPLVAELQAWQAEPCLRAARLLRVLLVVGEDAVHQHLPLLLPALLRALLSPALAPLAADCLAVTACFSPPGLLLSTLSSRATDPGGDTSSRAAAVQALAHVVRGAGGQGVLAPHLPALLELLLGCEALVAGEAPALHCALLQLVLALLDCCGQACGGERERLVWLLLHVAAAQHVIAPPASALAARHPPTQPPPPAAAAPPLMAEAVLEALALALAAAPPPPPADPDPDHPDPDSSCSAGAQHQAPPQGSCSPSCSPSCNHSRSNPGNSSSSSSRGGGEPSHAPPPPPPAVDQLVAAVRLPLLQRFMASPAAGTPLLRATVLAQLLLTHRGASQGLETSRPDPLTRGAASGQLLSPGSDPLWAQLLRGAVAGAPSVQPLPPPGPAPAAPSPAALLDTPSHTPPYPHPHPLTSTPPPSPCPSLPHCPNPGLAPPPSPFPNLPPPPTPSPARRLPCPAPPPPPPPALWTCESACAALSAVRQQQAALQAAPRCAAVVVAAVVSPGLGLLHGLTPLTRKAGAAGPGSGGGQGAGAAGQGQGAGAAGCEAAAGGAAWSAAEGGEVSMVVVQQCLVEVVEGLGAGALPAPQPLLLPLQPQG